MTALRVHHDLSGDPDDLARWLGRRETDRWFAATMASDQAKAPWLLLTLDDQGIAYAGGAYQEGEAHLLGCSNVTADDGQAAPAVLDPSR
jgi:hypothetical protein